MPLLFSSFLFSASRLHAPPSQHWSCQSPSIPPPFRCLSAHLRLHRSWPFPCSSHRFGSWLYHITASPSNAVSNHLRYSQRRSVSSLFTASLNKADQIRCRLCPGASGYAQRCRLNSADFISKLLPGFSWLSLHGSSASVRILAPPLASFPNLLVSAPVPASPYLRHANLGESILRSAVSYRVSSVRFRIRSDQVPSQHLKALSMRLKQSRADHLRCFSSPFDANPLTSKPWPFSAACADQCRSGSALCPSALFHTNPYLDASPILVSLLFRFVSNQVEASP